MDIDWQSVGTFTTGLLGGGGGLKLILTFLDRWNSKKSKEAFEDIVHIYEAMADIANNTPFKRILVVSTHNGGEEIKPSSKLFSSVLYEHSTPPLRSVKREYQDLPLDASYVSILLSLLQDGAFFGEVKDLRPGILKSMYENDKVVYAEKHYLANHKRKKIWYLSCTMDVDGSKLTGYHKLIVHKNVEQISSILKKHS